MKKFILFIFISFLLPALHASCGPRYPYIMFPGSGIIAGNSIFALGYSSNSLYDSLFQNEHAVVLYSGADTIPLVIKQINHIGFWFSQVVLTPKFLLQSGKTYAVHMGEIPDDYLREFQWTVSARMDTTRPKWITEPKFLDWEYKTYGCGPERNLFFCGCASDQFQTAVIVRMKYEAGYQGGECILPDRNGLFEIGHGMCSGPFKYMDSTSCEISFELIDGSGNSSGSSTAPMVIRSPLQSDGRAELNCECPVQNVPDESEGLFILIGAVLFIAGLCVYEIAVK